MVIRLSHILCCRQLDESRATEEESLHVEGLHWQDTPRLHGEPRDPNERERDPLADDDFDDDAKVDAIVNAMGDDVLRAAFGQPRAQVPVFPAQRAEPPSGTKRCVSWVQVGTGHWKHVINDENMAPPSNGALNSAAAKMAIKAIKGPTLLPRKVLPAAPVSAQPMRSERLAVADGSASDAPREPSSVEVPIGRLAAKYLHGTASSENQRARQQPSRFPQARPILQPITAHASPRTSSRPPPASSSAANPRASSSFAPTAPTSPGGKQASRSGSVTVFDVDSTDCAQNSSTTAAPARSGSNCRGIVRLEAKERLDGRQKAQPNPLCRSASIDHPRRPSTDSIRGKNPLCRSNSVDQPRVPAQDRATSSAQASVRPPALPQTSRSASIDCPKPGAPAPTVRSRGSTGVPSSSSQRTCSSPAAAPSKGSAQTNGFGSPISAWRPLGDGSPAPLTDVSVSSMRGAAAEARISQSPPGMRAGSIPRKATSPCSPEPVNILQREFSEEHLRIIAEHLDLMRELSQEADDNPVDASGLLFADEGVVPIDSTDEAAVVGPRASARAVWAEPATDHDSYEEAKRQAKALKATVFWHPPPEAARVCDVAKATTTALSLPAREARLSPREMTALCTPLPGSKPKIPCSATPGKQKQPRQGMAAAHQRRHPAAGTAASTSPTKLVEPSQAIQVHPRSQWFASPPRPTNTGVWTDRGHVLGEAGTSRPAVAFAQPPATFGQGLTSFWKRPYHSYSPSMTATV
mmetsp:Transcript_41371/g.74882  ORF Transcript_41371/g.74882 Transcript_41371/m.74882 type:complete len:750 (+) Transcript_41371:50-2299(+)